MVSWHVLLLMNANKIVHYALRIVLFLSWQVLQHPTTSAFVSAKRVTCSWIKACTMRGSSASFEPGDFPKKMVVYGLGPRSGEESPQQLRSAIQRSCGTQPCANQTNTLKTRGCCDLTSVAVVPPNLVVPDREISVFVREITKRNQRAFKMLS